MSGIHPSETVKAIGFGEIPRGGGLETLADAPVKTEQKPILGETLSAKTLAGDVYFDGQGGMFGGGKEPSQEKVSLPQKIVKKVKTVDKVVEKASWYAAALTGAAFAVEYIVVEGSAGVIAIGALKLLGFTVTSLGIPVLIVPLIIFLGRKVIMKSIVWAKDWVKEKWQLHK